MSRYSSSTSTDLSAPLPGSNFLALHKLKQTDNQLDLMKRRLSALLIKQEKLNRKSQSAIKKLKYHEMIQQMQKKQREKKLIHRQEVELKLQSQRRMNSAQRFTRKQKLQEVRNSHLEMKTSRYKVERQAARELQSRIQHLDEQQHKTRKEMYVQVKNYQMQSRKHYQLYRLERQNEIRWAKEMEHSRLLDEQERKEIKREDLAEMEREILQRQAKSREAAERSTTDLKRIIDPRLSLSANQQHLKEALLANRKNPEDKEG